MENCLSPFSGDDIDNINIRSHEIALAGIGFRYQIQLTGFHTTGAFANVNFPLQSFQHHLSISAVGPGLAYRVDTSFLRMF